MAYENNVQIPFDKTLEVQGIHPNDTLYGISLFFFLLVVIYKDDAIITKTIKILSEKGTFEYEFDGNNKIEFYLTKVLLVCFDYIM